MDDTRRWHYVRRNETSRQPRRHIFMDTEAVSTRTATGWEQTWRLGVAVYRDAPKGKPARESLKAYQLYGDLWRDVTKHVPSKGRCILWTHNLGYDVRISHALTELPARGWRLTGHNLAPGGTWMAWRRGDQSLVMVDSASVFPTTLAELARHFQREKLPLPDQGATDRDWRARCVRDVMILRDAVVAYLARLETLDLGNWQMTGTAQAWAAFRHRHLTHDMLVHWDDDARDAERRAMWTGRCEAYWHGRLHGTRVDEWDMTLAYPRIAARHDVPVALVTPIGTDAQLARWLRRDGYAVLAEIDVDIDVPLLPAERGDRICWPVGGFRTVVWDPELRLAMEHGARVRLVRGWVYRAEPALASWAQWIIGQLEAPETEVPAWWKMVMKHWARALIGRMAMTYRSWEHVGTMRRADVRRMTYVDRDTGRAGEAVQIGHDLFMATDVEPWSQSMPMVTGYVQSVGRATLARLWMDAPEKAVLYVDTDSLIASASHHDAMAALAARHPDAGLRLKRSWDGVEIRGPRQLVTGPRVRVSGIPRRAVRMPDGTLSGEVWQSLTGAVSDRRAGTVRITSRRWHLRAVDTRRALGADGWTVPIIMGRS